MVNQFKSYLNNIDWNAHINIFKEGIMIVGKIAIIIVAICALLTTLITFFSWTIIPILFFIGISLYAIWMIGNISITKKKWDTERNQQ